MKKPKIHIKPSHEGKLRHGLKAKKGSKIPVSKLEAAKHSKDPAVRKRAQFALNSRKWAKK